MQTMATVYNICMALRIERHHARSIYHLPHGLAEKNKDEHPGPTFARPPVPKTQASIHLYTAQHARRQVYNVYVYSKTKTIFFNVLDLVPDLRVRPSRVRQNGDLRSR